MVTITYVQDDEKLYRVVRYDPPDGRGLYTIRDGTLRLSSQVFSHRSLRVSVDRALMCNHDPAYSQRAPSDGVASVYAGEARSIASISRQSVPGTVERFSADVEHKPVEGNDAHAEIFLNPDTDNRQLYRKLYEALARIAEQHGWEIEPHAPS